MNIDLSSFAFGSTLDEGTGTPSWGTALGQSSPNYYFTKSGFQNILFGMVYCSVPLINVSLPLGRGGQVNKCSENKTIQLASLFKKVYINGHKIHYPFIMVLQKEDSASHNGRRSIKYTEKAVYEDDYGRIKYSNEEFLEEVRKEFKLTDDACWFVYNIDVKNQDELHFSAYFVNKEEKVSYHDSKQRSAIWTELLTSSNGPFKPFNIKELIESIKSTNLIYSDILIKRFAFSLLTKPFVILSGLAGSGKTQLALALAKSLVEDEKQQLCVVSVGADWTNREPLLGYPNALEAGKYVRPESGVLDLLIECNKDENKDKPFFLILDEMNLSYVERYFADFLSAMESHQAIHLWKKEDDFDDETPDSIILPQNLFIIGTINVDETTYMFSPKVLDRANVIEFAVSEDDMSNFLAMSPDVDMSLCEGLAADMAADFVKIASTKKEISSDANEVLNNFFKNLKKANAEFGYRTATEIGRFISLASESMGTENAVDAAIVQKLLPKLHGSRKKIVSVTKELWKLCGCEDLDTLESSDPSVAKYKLTADKVLRMYNSAIENGFTSFAEA